MIATTIVLQYLAQKVKTFTAACASLNATKGILLDSLKYPSFERGCIWRWPL